MLFHELYLCLTICWKQYVWYAVREGRKGFQEMDIFRRGRCELCPSQRLCKWGTSAVRGRTPCKPPSVHREWKQCWPPCPCTLYRCAPPATFSAVPPWVNLENTTRGQTMMSNKAVLPHRAADSSNGFPFLFLSEELSQSMSNIFIPERSWLGDVASLAWAEIAVKTTNKWDQCFLLVLWVSLWLFIVLGVLVVCHSKIFASCTTKFNPVCSNSHAYHE